jgi:ATP-dependent RNA helicase SUPV3L1/SUV3
MGLNLPIKTILFTTDTKYDGIETRHLKTIEIVQIAGRAGRYGYHEAGFIGAIKPSILKNISEIYNQSIKTIKPPFKVKASNSQLDQLSQLLKTHSLNKILDFYAKNMYFSGPFRATNISSMIETSKIVENHYQYLTLEQKYILAQAPINTRSPLILSGFKFYLSAISQRKIIQYKLSININKPATTQLELLKAEDEVKKISLYLWLSYKLPDIFTDEMKARELRSKVNVYIEKSLKNNKELKRDDKFKRGRGRRINDKDNRNNKNSRRTKYSRNPQDFKDDRPRRSKSRKTRDRTKENKKHHSM